MVKASPPQANRESWFVKVRLLVRFQQQTQNKKPHTTFCIVHTLRDTHHTVAVSSNFGEPQHRH